MHITLGPIGFTWMEVVTDPWAINRLDEFFKAVNNCPLLLIKAMELGKIAEFMRSNLKFDN
jgi:hypothetical protein